MSKVIITADPLYRLDGPHVGLLRAAGLEVLNPPKIPFAGEDQVIEALAGASAVIAGSEPYTARVLSALPGLRIIARSGVGYDRIDLDAADRLGVAVAITPDANSAAVAEHTIALLLALTRSIVASAGETRRGLWIRRPLVPLRRRTLGIVGLGRVGRAVAQRVGPLGMTVLGFDPLAAQELAREHSVEITEFDELLARSDFVTLHLPLTAETRGLINRKTLARMKDGSYLINTSRGGLIVEADLLEALRTGRLAGAGLDVLADEPPLADNPLLFVENVIITPHVASNDVQAIEDMGMAAARNIIDLFQGYASRIPLVTRRRE
jgi:D-3-phosphoglycerate dehydrogenase / 2-oxoglutarate reductase